jgi:hypothetical protein
MPRSTTSIVLYLCLVFGSGVLVGGFGYRLINPPEPKGDPRVRYEQEMRERLKLSPEQAQKFHAILESTGQRFQAVREKFRPEFQAVYKDQVESVNQILDARQRDEYAKFQREKEEQRKRKQQAKK